MHVEPGDSTVDADQEYREACAAAYGAYGLAIAKVESERVHAIGVAYRRYVARMQPATRIEDAKL